MQAIQKPDLYPEIEVHFYTEGILIRSKINIENIDSNKRNYEIPIIILANETFGFCLVQGLNTYQINNVSINELQINNATLMMSSSNNWWVFIPTKNLSKDEMEIIINKLQVLHYEKLSIYAMDDYELNTSQILNNKRLCFVFGMGVE